MIDPRTQLPAAVPQMDDVRPTVSVRQNNWPLWAFGAMMALVALFLFNTLEARRKQAAAPIVVPKRTDMVVASRAAPELYVPDYYESYPRPVARSSFPLYPTRPTPTYRPQQPAVARVIQPVREPPPRREPIPNAAPPRYTPAPVLEPRPLPPYISPPPPPQRIGERGQARVEATRFSNPSTTIPQGALISAVLETALDSTRGGQTRALVTRDVRGFDGTQVLVPRGSRLIGEYRADLGPGQNRALVQWTRIIRPDGVTIALDSPAADTLGRAGVKGKVNSHLLERITSAVLTSAVNIGQAAATRGISGNSPVVVAVPTGSGGQEIAQAMTYGMQVRPTLTVKQGSRVTVFVARDLDFTTIGTP